MNGKLNRLESHLERQYRQWSIIVLLFMFGLALTSMAQKAPTFDEQGFIVRGLAYLRGHKQIRVGHPLGLNAVNSAFLVHDETVNLPLDDPSWQGTSFHRPAELFLWEIGNDVEHIMFLARLPTIWMGMLLAAVAGRWTKDIAGRKWPALMALVFVALDPNILAHTRLTTTDLGLTATALLAAYMLWRYMRAPSWKNIVLAGIALGFLQNTKFTSGLFVLLFALVALIWLVQTWIGRLHGENAASSTMSVIPWRPILMLLLVYPLTAVLTLWALYGFEIGQMSPDLPMLSFLAGRIVPLPNHIEQLLDIGGRLSVGTPTFLLGQYSDSGWWYYFPTAFLLKTPLPILLLIAWGTVVFLICNIYYRRKGNCLSLLDSTALLIPAIGYFVIALTGDINLGYRHILPILPFLVVFSTGSIARSAQWKKFTASVAAAAFLAVWLALIALIIYPDYLAYFNLFAGGPQKGWRSLVDSNLDWGQDLDDLPIWMARHGVEEVWLSYFGEARPEYYSIAYKGLDSFPPRLMNPLARPYYPHDPAPGVYAISATNLQGVQFTNHDEFAWFREQSAIDSLGHSIFIYQVPAHGETAALILAGVQIDEIYPDDFAQMVTNDVNPRWVDLTQTMVFPQNMPVWLITGSDIVPHPKFDAYISAATPVNIVSPNYQMARIPALELSDSILKVFSHGKGQVLLQDASGIVENGLLRVVTQWEQAGEQIPLKFFVHLVDPDGQIISQWDGIGAAWEGFYGGDRLLQVHELSLPEDEIKVDYRLLVGVYDPLSGERWLTEDGEDHFTIESFSLP